MEQSRRHIVFQILYILTAILLVIALYYAIKMGFLTGIKGIYSESLPEVYGRAARHPRLTLGAMILLLFIFLMSAGGWLARATRKQCIVVGIVLTAFILGLQLYFVFGLNIIQNTDAFEVQDQAKAIADGILKSVDYTHTKYFRKYGNNDLYLMICILMYKACNFLHITAWEKAFALFNMFCIDTGVFLSCHILAMLKDRRVALQALLLNALNPLNYVFLHWTYTCTFSIPLMLLGIYLVIRILKHPDQYLCNGILALLIGLVSAFGYKLRPTAVFPTIALLVCLIIRDVPKFFRKVRENHIAKKHPRLKVYFIRCVTLAAALVVMAGTSQGIDRAAKRFDTDNTYNFPLEHWLMVGMTKNGRLDASDMEYTASFPTKEEKKEADLKVLKEAVESRTPKETVQFFMNKIATSWSDGTGEYYTRTSQSDNSNVLLYQYVSGSSRGGLMLYCHAFRIILLFLAIIGILRECGRGAGDFLFSMITVTILGGLVFYMFWEGKPVYSLPFMPFLAFLACDVWSPMSAAYQTTLHRVSAIRRIQRIIVVGVIALTIVIFSRDSWYELEVQHYTIWDISSSSPVVKRSVKLQQKDTMTQEFTARYTFNRIGIGVKKRKNVRNEGSYRITLSCDGKILQEFNVTSADVKHKMITLSFPEIRPKAGQIYTISITNLSEGEPSLQWYIRKGYVTSQYQGDRYINGRFQNCDMLLDVYEEYDF